MAEQEPYTREYIDKYINGELTSDESDVFESKMANDKALSNQVALQRELIFGLEGLAIREHIQAAHVASKNRNKRVRTLWISAAAASLALLLVFWIVYQPAQTDSSLFSQFFRPFPDVISIRNTDADNSGIGMNHYVAGEYQKAIEYLSLADNASENYIDLRFYLGLSYLASNIPDESIAVFNELITIDSQYKQQIRWYLALAYLRNGERSKSILYLNQISAGDFQFEAAQELLKVMIVEGN